MKIGIIGTGAVGGYFGARLAQNGEDVLFIARRNTLKALKEKGLIIESYTGNFTIESPKVSPRFEDLADRDLILLCTKSYHTEEIASALKPHLKPKTIILSMQNGVDNEEKLTKILDKNPIIGSVVFITAGIKKSGVIKHTSYGKITIGEMNGEITDRTQVIEKMFLNAAIPASITTNIKKELWKKLMLNIAYNGLTAIVRSSLTKFDDIKEAQETFYEALKEVQLVASSEGINITNKEVDEAYEFTKTKGFTGFKSSTLIDAEAGKPLEIDALQGAVIRSAKKNSIYIPINKTLYALLKLIY